jgi:1-acyl-sn-glycerol-3-phosphate acyltransferase
LILGNFILRITEYLYRNKIIFWIGFSALLLFLVIGIRRVKISESIFATLPKGETFQSLNTFIENKNISNQVVFSLKVSDKKNPEELEQTVQLFTDTLIQLSGNYLTDVISIRPDIDLQVYDYFYNSFPYFIDSTYYKLIDNKLIHDSINTSIGASYRQLTGPASSFLKKIILNDPLYVTGDFFKNLGATADKNFVIEDGLVFNKNKTSILITAGTKYGSDSSGANLKLYNLLEKYKVRWNALHPLHKMDYFGTFEIAAENEIQVKKDTLFTITITLVILILILFVYYRKLIIPLYFILPPIFGAIFAIGVMGYIHPKIAAISLATGAVLLGIILDYSFHFFTHLRHTRSISTTLKEISSPLITGSFTTITAFSALQFANSPVLQDFGLFAGLCLSGAALFTLVCLPVVLQLLSFNYETIPDEPFSFNFPSFSKKFKYISLGIILLLTFVFLISSSSVKFDSQLENMSFHTSNLKFKEQELTGLNSEIEKRLYFFVTDSSYETACTKNYELFRQIELLRRKDEVKNVLSTGHFLIPKKIKKEREEKWLAYWNIKKLELFPHLLHASDSVGFNGSAFTGFESWINRKDFESINTDTLLKSIGLNNLVTVEKNKTTFVTTIVVNNANRNKIKAQLQQIKGVEVFDRAEVASSLLTSVKDDFNYILILSALIVFVTLLVIYGRVELALFAFFPMLVSWIWIIGIAGLLDIKFNFVNVVISTFIFGLGDDYSIFVTDGLLNRYKYGKRTLGSYSSAIILSAICTIVGTGILIFAKHPAIHSVAIVSVLGIACILLLSLIFQPILFDVFIQGRINSKKPPITLLEFVISVFEFAYWIIICISFYIIGFVLILLPISRKTKAYILNSIISFFAKSVIYLGIHTKKNIFGIKNLDIKKPSIIIANHSSFLDILLVIMLNPRIIILVKDWVYKSPLFGIFIRYAGYIYSEGGTEENLDKIKKRLEDGYSILIFPEGTRSIDGKINRFHKGAFYLAHHLNIDITPILIHGADYVLPKNDYIVKRGSLNVKVLPRISATDISWGSTYTERAKKISAYFKTEYVTFKNEQETAEFLWNRVFCNYIFKGPVLEWYVRIKWKLESKNYENYNAIIGERNKVLDVGCGYGYFSLYLHYKNENREITAIDYDEEKIEIAENAFDKNDNLKFIYADINEITIAQQDVIFINDVLHYLPEKNQLDFLEKCNHALTQNGIIIIRDGITDFTERHSKTKLTELFSTKVFKFNKKNNEFHFFSSEFIKSFALKNGLIYEMREQSNKTSNVLFTLKKK